MAHLLMMGAAGIQMGTLFVMSEECNAHPKFKAVFQKANARDAAIDGNVQRGALMAGQSVGLVNKIKSIQGIIDKMVNDAEHELQRLNKIFSAT